MYASVQLAKKRSLPPVLPTHASWLGRAGHCAMRCRRLRSVIRRDNFQVYRGRDAPGTYGRHGPVREVSEEHEADTFTG